MTQKEHFERLPQKIRELILNGSEEERITFIERPKFIEHTKFEKLCEKLDELYYAPKTNRIRSLLLVGESNNGKTEMVRRYKKMKFRNDIESETMDYEDPVLLIQAPSRANLHELYDLFFMEFLVPYNKNESLVEREQKIKYYCDRFNIKMIIIDEIQNALIGSITKQREFMAGVKNLSNTLKIPIVLVGTPKGTSLVVNDHQLKSRFVPTRIKRWSYDDDYFSLLYAIETSLPLKKPSLIYEKEKFAMDILELSDGLIGEIISIVSLMAKYAIQNGDEAVKPGMLKKIKYVPAKDREGVVYADEI